MILRDYQKEGVDNTVKLIKKGKHPLGVAATGLGKTVMFSFVAKEIMKSTGKRVLLIANRGEHLYQGKRSLEKITGESVAIEKASVGSDEDLFFAKPKIIAGMVQTLTAGTNQKRMDKFDPEEFGLIIIDECHYSQSKTYRQIVDYFKEGNSSINIFGVTATPKRGDGIALANTFDCISFYYDTKFGINNGWLVPARHNLVHLGELDYSWVKVHKGEFDQKQMNEVYSDDKLLIKMAGTITDVSQDRKSIIFCQSVSEAESLTEYINAIKPNSCCIVTGKTGSIDRMEILSDYGLGRYQFFCNVGVAMEGYDDEDTSIVSLCVLTKSNRKLIQMIGRGLRLSGDLARCHDFANDTSENRRLRISKSSKPFAEILDFRGNSGINTVASPYEALMGEEIPAEVVKVAEKIAQEKDGAIDVNEVMKLAEEELEEMERQKKIREDQWQLKVQVRYTKESVDIFSHTTLKKNIDLNGLNPLDARLTKLGINNVNSLSREEKIEFDRIIKTRQAKNLATLKQVKVLKRYGIDAENMPFNDASYFIGECFKLNRRPMHMDEKWLINKDHNNG